MSRYLERIYFISVLLLLGVVYLQEFINLKVFSEIKIIILCVVILSSLFLARGTAFFMSIISLLIGHFLILKYQMPISVWFEGITKNLHLAIVFIMVPVLSIPLKAGGYLETVNYLVSKNAAKGRRLFTALSGSVFGLASIANLGAIRVINDLIEAVNLPPKFLGKVYSVGFASCIAWSPYFASVNLVLYYTGVPFNRFFLVGFFYGLMVLLIGNFLFYFDKESQILISSCIQKIPEPAESKKKFAFLILNILGLFSAVVIGERILRFSSMMLLVGILAFLYASFWSLLINKFREFWQQLRSYDQIILQVKNELVFFLSVGFLGVVLANTPLQKILEVLFGNISGYSTFIIVEAIVFITALLSAAGIHHVITVTALGLSIPAGALGLSDLAYALTLVGAYTVSMITSPFAPFNILAGGLLKESSFVISLRWNRSFALITVLFSGLYVLIINYFWV
ncbi:MAG: hypothetical protein GXW85_05645 [Clostridia bacterium]|nr:hypothetical protein [Clostridia bacterium]